MSSKALSKSREVHLIDIENLLGGSWFNADQVAQFRAFYLSHNNVADDAQIILATSSEQGAIEAGLGWAGARTLFRLGHDGADLALLEVLEEENLHARFTKIVIASGDGIFATAAEQLYAEGLQVEVFARALSVSGEFTHASEIVHLFSASEFSLAA